MRTSLIAVLAFAAAVASSVAACSSSSTTTAGTGATNSPSNTPTHDAGAAQDATGAAEAGGTVCPAVIGHWLATLDQGATVTLQGAQMPISGTIDFTLTHDDGDLDNIVDFNGTAKIVFAGQTVTQVIQPAKSPSGDPKDVTCNGGLHLTGMANVQGFGDILFTIDGTLDTNATPVTGQGTFGMKTVSDDGGTATGSGPLHMVKQAP